MFATRLLVKLQTYILCRDTYIRYVYMDMYGYAWIRMDTHRHVWIRGIQRD